MKIRISKVRRTDYRANATSSPITGLDHLARIQSREAAEHDRAVADYPPHLIDSAATDLARRPASNPRDPEQRWIMARKAALGRRAASFPKR